MSDTFEFEDQSRVERLTGTLHDPAATTGDVLTVQADKSIAAQPGGGGSGGVQVVTVPVSSAQILDLANTDATLIAGVPGSVIVVTGIALTYVAGATPYTDNGGNVSYALGAAHSFPAGVQPGATLWTDPASQFVAFPYGLETSIGVVASSAVAGLDLVLFEDTANPTLGDGTLLVTVSYFLAPTV